MTTIYAIVNPDGVEYAGGRILDDLIGMCDRVPGGRIINKATGATVWPEPTE